MRSAPSESPLATVGRTRLDRYVQPGQRREVHRVRAAGAARTARSWPTNLLGSSYSMDLDTWQEATSTATGRMTVSLGTLGAPQVYTLLRSGASYTALGPIDGPWCPWAFDMNGDGRTDAACVFYDALSTPAGVLLLFAKPDGTFEQSQKLTLAPFPEAWTAVVWTKGGFPVPSS